MSAFSEEEKKVLYDILTEKGFEFQNIKIRKPGKGITDNRMGTAILDNERFGNTVICVNLDAESDQWSLAPSWEIALISPTKIPDVTNGEKKLAAAAFVSNIKRELGEAVKNAKAQGADQKSEDLPEGNDEVSPERLVELQKDLAEELEKPEPVEEKPTEEEQKGTAERIPTQTAASPEPAPNPLDVPLPAVEQVIRNVTQSNVHVTKNAKGNYQWEISVHEDDIFLAIDKAIAADDLLRKRYGGYVSISDDNSN